MSTEKAANFYNENFYKTVAGEPSARSARIICPAIKFLFPEIRSVVDFGCGIGAFLREFMNMGMSVLGLDFGAAVPENLVIPKDRFLNADLARPITLDPKLDLCVSLEVAEHLPPEAADQFVASLCSAADIALFSAAIPAQGGTSHVNEQWPAYLIGKFREHGFAAYDVLRPVFWRNDEIAWWYRQNIMLFVSGDYDLAGNPITGMTSFYGMPLAHPQNYELKINYLVQMMSQAR